MNKWLFIFALLIANTSWAQKEITWETLGDVVYTDKYFESVEAYVYYPDFGPSVEALDGQMVYIEGYVLAIDPVENFYVLSRHPYASCFFCGQGGPETVVQLELKSTDTFFSMDQMVTIKGRLRLNADDIENCNYILEDAEVYKKPRY